MAISITTEEICKRMKEHKLSEAAKLLGVHRDTVIYWEENSLIPKPRRNPKNNYRTYNIDEIKRIAEIRGINDSGLDKM